MAPDFFQGGTESLLQLNRRVDLNLEIKRLESQLAALFQSLATANESR